MFYEVKSITSNPRTFDFTDSGGPVVETVSVFGDGNLLINSTDFFEYGEDQFQTEICETCGTPGCSSGSWVSLRKVGDVPVLTPAMSAIRDDELNGYFEPPKLLYKYGAIKFSPASYFEFRKLLTQLPEIDDVKPISVLEVLGIQKLAIPGRALGKLYEPTEIRRDVFLAASEGDVKVLLDEYQTLLDDIEKGSVAIYSDTPDEIIEFYLDLPEFPSWNRLGRKNGRPILNCPVN